MSGIRQREGISLVEILFSSALISLVLIGTLTIFVQTVDISKRIDYEYTATNLAKSRLERARALIATSGFDFLPDLAETDTVVDSNGAPDTDGDFKRSTTIITSYTENPRLTRVDVDVVYRYKGQWKTQIPITMVTIFTNVS